MFHSVIVPVVLGFAIFMFGMKTMELALHGLFAPHLDRLLRKFTATPLHGLAVGTAQWPFCKAARPLPLSRSDWSTRGC